MKINMLFHRIEDPMQRSGNVAGGGRKFELPELERLIGSKVVDSNGEDVGKLHCIWEDESHQASFLGVKTGWLGMGLIHVVPAESAQFSQYSNTIKMPYSKEKIKSAPSSDVDEDITGEREGEIYQYYGITGRTTRTEERTEPSVGERMKEKTQALGEKTSQAVRGGVRTQEEARIPLHEEELKVGKRQVEVGGVRLRKIIRTETVNQPVEVKREELVVEKAPASGGPSERAFEGEEIYIPLRAEEPVIEKQTRVKEEARVRKQATAEQRNVSETVRKEEIETEKQGQVEEHEHEHV